MRKIVFLFWLIAMFSFVSNAFAGYELEKYYPLTAGDSWSYFTKERLRSDSEEIVSLQEVSVVGPERVDGKETTKILKKFSAEEQSQYFMLRDSEGIKMYKILEMEDGEYRIFDPPYLLFPAQIEEGKSIESVSNVTYFDGSGKVVDKSRMERKISLAGVENLNIKAGLINDALKLFLTEKYNHEDGSFELNSCTVWLAPGIGLVKEIFQSSVMKYKNKNNNLEPKKEERVAELNNATVNGRRIGP